MKHSFLVAVAAMATLTTGPTFLRAQEPEGLDGTWKGFASGLDERTTVLALSVLFHQKAETVSNTILFSYISILY